MAHMAQTTKTTTIVIRRNAAKEEITEWIYKEVVRAWQESHMVDFDIALGFDNITLSIKPSASREERVEICEQCNENELLRIRGTIYIPIIDEGTDMLAETLAGMVVEYPDYTCYIGTLLFLGVRDVRVRRFKP